MIDWCPHASFWVDDFKRCNAMRPDSEERTSKYLTLKLRNGMESKPASSHIPEL
jgi:hypothetical protein